MQSDFFIDEEMIASLNSNGIAWVVKSPTVNGETRQLAWVC
jgi:hypothetical protein